MKKQLKFLILLLLFALLLCREIQAGIDFKMSKRMNSSVMLETLVNLRKSIEILDFKQIENHKRRIFDYLQLTKEERILITKDFKKLDNAQLSFSETYKTRILHNAVNNLLQRDVNSIIHSKVVRHTAHLFGLLFYHIEKGEYNEINPILTDIERILRAVLGKYDDLFTDLITALKNSNKYIIKYIIYNLRETLNITPLIYPERGESFKNAKISEYLKRIQYYVDRNDFDSAIEEYGRMDSRITGVGAGFRAYSCFIY